MKHLLRPTRQSRTVFYSGIIVATATLASLSNSPNTIAQVLFQDSPKAIVDQAWQIVNRQFVDREFNGVDWQAVRQDLLSRHYSSPEAAYDALRQALKPLNDPYTRFFDPEEYEALGTQIYGELSGIGLRLRQDQATQRLTVSELLDNTPASQSELRVGDRLVAIDGKPTDGMSLKDATQLIHGEVGTQVTLRVQRNAQQPFDVSLTRSRIEIPTVHAQVKQEGASKIGYIQLDVFSTSSAAQMQQAIQTLQKQHVDGFVLDLRDNGGGIVQSAIEIARMWMNTGKIVQVVDRDGNREVIHANQTALTQKPLAVLVNGNSASASEILTGALMDNRRAVVVGTQTFGKAVVQQVHPLPDGSALTVTTAHYYTPNGTDISHRGIAPNVVANLSDAQQLATNQVLRGAAADWQYHQAVNSLQALSHAGLFVSNGPDGDTDRQIH